MDVEEALDRFEAAWQRGSPPEIRELLGSRAARSMDRVARQNLLGELVMIDLWYRWRRAARGQGAAVSPVPGEQGTRGAEAEVPAGPLPHLPRLEDYVREYPELGPLEEVPPVLIGEEYRARQQWGDRPTHQDYLTRFPHHAPQLEQLLPAIDRELAGDTLPSHVTSTSEGAEKVSGTFCRNGPQGASQKRFLTPFLPAKIGKYHVVGILEEGGQAEVYRAVHPTLSIELVIKLGRRRAGSAPMDQLIAEGKLLAELDHPHLARVYDLGFHQGRPFLVMQYVRGRNLRHCARQHRYAPRQAALLVAKIARALAVAHARGIIHQDVKPGNIIIDESGEPRVIDFGLARLRPAWVEEPDEPEGISGTVQYMAPEQARGDTQCIDPRTDIFALGAVLYFLLVGRAPFADQDILASLERARRCDFDASALRKAGVPRGLEAVCLRAMQPEPADRYATAEAMAADLERFIAMPRRLKQALGVVAGLFVLSVVAVGAWIMQGDNREKLPSRSALAEPSDPARDLLGRPLRHDFLLEFQVLGHPIDKGSQVVLTEGEHATFRIEAERDCYVGIWHVDGEGVTLLFPNEYEYDHLTLAGEARTVPGENAGYAIPVTASQGKEYLHVVASTERWEAPRGKQKGPYIVFATPEELKRWRTQVRGMDLKKGQSPAIAEQLLVLEVRSN